MTDVSRESIEQAALWMARLWADDVTEQDKKSFQTWLAAHPDNAYAWSQLELLQQKFSAIPATPATRKTLLNRTRVSRRQVLSLAGVGFATAGLGFSLAEPSSGLEYATAVGEVREVLLSDGTEMVMNTASRVEVDFNHSERRIRLIEGEVLITTAHHKTPFYITTHAGNVVPIGTRFTVRKLDAHINVAVYEGEVELQPKLGLANLRIIAGENANFSPSNISEPITNEFSDALWLQQKIVANGMPLDEFLTELSRYRRGVLRIDPSLKYLNITGVFSTRNTDQTLHNLTQVLPIEVNYRTSLWVTVIPK